MKIVITGGLGYIGTKLCEHYSGEARYKDIVVVDTRFASERVRQLCDWGISFVHGSILDEALMQEILAGADLVYHLAGITDVAYVKTEADEARDRLITETGITGTAVILKAAPQSCKVVFPSTHVVFEGLSETRFDISEDEPVCPVLTYAKGKAQSEADLRANRDNHVIMRLGTVYGYSGDTMRINIMPNLFSKITSQGGTIKLFSGGSQYKSLVYLEDVVRAMKFLGESVNRGTYHISAENLTIKQVAEICRDACKDVNIIETDDEVPNLGYTLSSNKLRETGFTFHGNITNAIREMVSNWTKTVYPDALEYIIRGDKEFVDARGRILNYELTEPINLIGYIESRPGTVRANHYHPIQEQKCLLISGEYVSVCKDLSVADSVIETRVIRAGDIAVIRPNVAHTMVFTRDSVFLNLVRGEREHENYGVTHTIPYLLVDETLRSRICSSYRTRCRVCDGDKLEDVVSLGMSPLANNLLNSVDQQADTYLLEMKRCADPNCCNCQLSYNAPAAEMFDTYLYVSSTSSSFVRHFTDAAAKYVEEMNICAGDLVIDIGSNDGIALKPYKALGIRGLGIEPAANLADMANAAGIDTVNGYLDKNLAASIVADHGSAKLITMSNVFAHSDDLHEMATSALSMLDADGTIVIEVQYLLNTLEDLTFDNMYHEHFNYWSMTSMCRMFDSLGAVCVRAERIPTHGGSLRVWVKASGERGETVRQLLRLERESGLVSGELHNRFKKGVESIRKNVRANMSKLAGKRVVGYGAPAKATTALNYFGVNCFEYLIDDNKLKHGLFLPGLNVEIKPKTVLDTDTPDYIVIMAWNFEKEIRAANAAVAARGTRFLTIKDLEKEDLSLC